MVAFGTSAFRLTGALDLILAAINTDLFEFVNLHYYYFFQRNAPAIELAKHKDMGVFIISPADKGGQLYTPPETLAQLCSPFSPLELNYRFLLSDTRIGTLSVGAANATELEQPLKYADRDFTLTSGRNRCVRSARIGDCSQFENRQMQPVLCLFALPGKHQHSRSIAASQSRRRMRHD